MAGIEFLPATYPGSSEPWKRAAVAGYPSMSTACFVVSLTLHLLARQLGECLLHHVEHLGRATNPISPSCLASPLSGPSTPRPLRVKHPGGVRDPGASEKLFESQNTNRDPDPSRQATGDLGRLARLHTAATGPLPASPRVSPRPPHASRRPFSDHQSPAQQAARCLPNSGPAQCRSGRCRADRTRPERYPTQPTNSQQPAQPPANRANRRRARHWNCYCRAIAVAIRLRGPV